MEIYEPAATFLMIAFGTVGLVLIYQWFQGWREMGFQFRLSTLFLIVTAAAIIAWLLR